MTVFEDGTSAAPDTVVWCTGFNHDYGWIQFSIPHEDGLPRHRDGIVEGEQGLYFVGLQFQSRLASALMGAGIDAKLVAE
jgi:putative flavoprotein involved in K+ transport